MSSEPHDGVVVVGAGPVGCVAAAFLVAAGIPVLMLEAAPQLPRELRASTFHPATLDMLEPLGVVPEMIGRGLIADRFQYRDRRAGVVAEFPMSLVSADTAHPFRLQCEQFKLCEILLAALDGNSLFEVRFDSRVTAAANAGDEVHLETAVGTVSAPWVFAADGASSAVRGSLDVEFDGMTYEDRYLVLSTTFEFADHLDALALVNYISDPEEWLVLLRTRDLWRALFAVPPGVGDDDALGEANAQERLQGVVPVREGYEIAHRTLYRVHQRVADRFRVGRVLLAGDAAHINNPLGGMGMNGGVHDAWLLSSGLADVWHGRAEPTVLDTYGAVRRDLAIEYVQRYTHENAVSLAAPDGAARQRALDEMAAKAADPVTAYEYVLQTSMIKAVRTMNERIQ